jgi:hypothetical protein
VKSIFFKTILANILLSGLIYAQNVVAQTDTLKIQHVGAVPVIDGVGNDACWAAPGVEWKSIDQVWMPWKGAVPAASDFTGKFKVVWNEPENLLYFLVDIIDDKFIDGYNFASNGPFGYPNYDVVEIFIDENRSKGPHVFDNGNENAQNALSYHINVNAPADGATTSEFTVEDLDGKDWGNYWVVNYASHFPGFSMKKMGDNYVYEFSMKVYNDTYPTQQKNGTTATDKELARVTLAARKVMGMSMAYCDNDLNDGKRDHFFGSSPGKEYSANFGFMGNGNSITSENGQDIFNTCWMSANDYGVVKLVGNTTSTAARTDILFEKISVFPTNVSSSFQLSIKAMETGKVSVDVFDLSGRKVMGFSSLKTSINFVEKFEVGFLNKGIYMARITLHNKVFVQKIVKQ